jgi:hypothetical protein
VAFLFDHLTAVLVGSVLLVALALVQQRGEADSVEASTTRIVQGRAAAFARTFERDVENLRPEAEARAALGAAYACAVTRDAAGRTTFAFPTLADPAAGPASPVVLVRYRAVATGDSAFVRGAMQPLLRVERAVEGGGAPVRASSDDLVNFDVALFAARSGTPLADCPPDLARVRLDLALAVPQPAAAPALARLSATPRPLARGG